MSGEDPRGLGSDVVWALKNSWDSNGLRGLFHKEKCAYWREAQ